MIDRNIHQVSEFSTVSNFLETSAVRPGISTIYSGGLPIDLLVSPANSDTTIFFLHGAIERDFTLPVLSGLGISGGIEANRVFVSDPSLLLDEQLRLSWYAGNYRQPDLQQVLLRIFKKIAESLESDRLVFFGGSGGGFASLYFASYFQNSLALVFNPQTNIEKYSERAVKDFATKAFQLETPDGNLLERLPTSVVVDLCKVYEAPKNTKIAYLQNANDKDHLRSHLSPFTEAIHPETEFLLLKEPWQDGHSPPPKELLSSLLNLAATSTSWVQDLTKAGFIKTPKVQENS